MVLGSALAMACCCEVLDGAVAEAAESGTTTIELPLENDLEVSTELARRAPAEPADQHTFHTWRLGVADTIALGAGLTFDAELHLDGGDLETFDVVPRVALGAELWAGATLELAWSDTARWPGGAGADTGCDGVAFTGMRTLELALDTELGGGATLHVAGVERRARMAMEGDALAGGTNGDAIGEVELALPEELEVARAVGGEVELGVEPVANVQVVLGYALDTIAAEPGGPLPFAHATQHRASVAAAWSSDDWIAKVSVRWVGTLHVTQASDAKTGTMKEASHLAPAVVIDGYVAHRLSEGTDVFVSLANALDEPWETYAWAPVLPRTVLAGLDVHTP